MSQRTDTVLRYALLAFGVAALLVMYLVAGDESFGRAGRFGLLAALGLAAMIGWPGTALAQPFDQRRPLRIRSGKPPRPNGDPAQPPGPRSPASLPVNVARNRASTFGALAAATAAALVLGGAGYALAGSASSNGAGLGFYIGFGAAVLVAGRSMVRLVTSGRAVVLDDAAIILGPALGYTPSHRIDRLSVANIESSLQPEPKLTLINNAGRRFEIRTDLLADPDLAGYVAALWPDVAWSEAAQT